MRTNSRANERVGVEENCSPNTYLFILCFETLQVYKGYLDDLRNTDNSWMETVSVNFHDETRETIGNFEFEVCYFNVMNMKFP